MNLETHTKFNNLLICVRNILLKYKRIDTKQILFQSLHPCFNLEEHTLKEALWYFMMSDDMQHWVMIDIFKKYEITKERIKGFSNNIQDLIYNDNSLSDKQKDILANKIHKYKINFLNIYKLI